MGEKETGAAMRGCVGDDVTQRECRCVFAAIMAGQVEAPCVIVDVSDPEALIAAIKVREAG